MGAELETLCSTLERLLRADREGPQAVFFAAISTAIGKKNNAMNRPSPRDHRPQGVTARVKVVVASFMQPDAA